MYKAVQPVDFVEPVKFGSVEYFTNYMTNQIEKENGNKQEIVARIHFSMTSIILETHKGKDAFEMIQNLTSVAEEITKWRKSYVL